jgi:hypothetical protein
MVYLEQRKRELEMIGFFDFDMTSAVTIGKETPSLSQFTDSRFAVKDILNAKPTTITNRMKRYKDIYILTARSSGNGKMRDAIQKYFLRNGIYIPTQKIIMVGDWNTDHKTSDKKRMVLQRYTKLGKIHFYDDDPNNVNGCKIRNVVSFQV